MTPTSKTQADLKPKGGQAESLFSKTRTQAMSLGRITSEQDAVNQARGAKTARLRELRLEKEAEERAASAVAPSRAGKR
ncbi:hypothetical protein [Mesorhizobium sp.]|uniref:hypothetical protein n=1 Tax=Mesorhizobium sp. TaxID=1871066 RepID=UPI0025C6C2BB|nr:hypothetical protein [Mesorhizobium sp.]